MRDRGAGIPQEIKPHLFKQMVTSKGSNGTGLGVFISNSVIKGKFEGRMWVEDNPGGGAIFGIGIPIDHVNFKSRQRREPNNYEKE